MNTTIDRPETAAAGSVPTIAPMPKSAQKSSYEGYQAFEERRATLLAFFDDLSPLLSSLQMSAFVTSLDAARERTASERFRVLILGEFKRGKSTFINALLGRKVLPAYHKPCTAIINEVKWGDTPRALLHFPDNSVAPESVDVDRLADYVTIKDKNGVPQPSPYDHVELFWPLPLCQNGVEIIDSPGLNENEVRQKVTMEYLSSVDAVVFVTACDALGSLSEIGVIDHTLRTAGHEELFFVCNKINYIDDDEVPDIKMRAYDLFGARTNFGNAGVYFVDALAALKGRVDGNESAVSGSGVPQVEEALERFLSRDRGRVKLLRPSQEARRMLREARMLLPERRKLLQIDLATLDARAGAAEAPLRQLKSDRDRMVRAADNAIREVRSEMVNLAREQYLTVADRLEGIAASFEPENRIRFFSLLGIKGQGERLASEIADHLIQQTEFAFSDWQKETIAPLLERRLEGIKEKLEPDARTFIRALDSVRFELATGLKKPSEGDGALPEEMRAPLWERIGAAVAGTFLADPVSGAIGATFGFKEMAKSAIQQILITLLTVVVVGFNPLILIPALLAGGIVQSTLKIQAATERLKDAVAKEMAQSLRTNAFESAQKMGDALDTSLKETVEQPLAQGLTNLIDGVTEQVESVRREKTKGESHVAEKLTEIDAIEAQLLHLERRLDDFQTDVLSL